MALVPFPNKAAKLADEDPEPDWDEEPASDDGGKMSFLEHLDELRRRIIYSVVAVAVGFVGAWAYRDYLFAFVFEPMQALLPGGQERLIYTELGEGFVVNIKLAAMAGLLAASPVVMSQIWLFIAPGLYSHEKKWAIPFVVLSTICFVGGSAFSHVVVFPLTYTFFASFTNEYAVMQPRIAPAFSIYLRMMLAFGLVFQLPVLVLFLARMGVLTARFMIKHFKYAVLGIFIISAVVTPGGEVVTQLAMAGPLTVLYVFSIGLAWAFGKKKTPALEEADD